MNMELITFVILAFAAYRITRILVIDTIFEGTRNRLHAFLFNQGQKNGKLRGLWAKLLDLTSCSWCMGVWVTLALYSVYLGGFPSNRFEWITLLGITGVQGMLHSLEPEDVHEH